MTGTASGKGASTAAEADTCPSCGGVVGVDACEDCDWPWVDGRRHLMEQVKHREAVISEERGHIAVLRGMLDKLGGPLL